METKHVFKDNASEVIDFYTVYLFFYSAGMSGKLLLRIGVGLHSQAPKNPPLVTGNPIQTPAAAAFEAARKIICQNIY